MSLTGRQREELHTLRTVQGRLTVEQLDRLGALALAADGQDWDVVRRVFREQAKLRRADEARRAS